MACVPVKELARKHGFSDASFCLWRSKFGGTLQGLFDGRHFVPLASGKSVLYEHHAICRDLTSAFDFVKPNETSFPEFRQGSNSADLIALTTRLRSRCRLCRIVSFKRPKYAAHVRCPMSYTIGNTLNWMQAN